MRTAPTMIALTMLAALTAGCSSGSANPPPPPVDWHAFDLPRYVDAGPSGPTARERAVAEEYASALASPDFGQLLPMLDDDAHFAFPGLSDARGRGGVLAAHNTLFGAFDQRAFATSRVWRTDNEQTLEWTMTGVQARDWMGVAATNKPVAIRGVTLLWTKDDGSIIDLHAYFDVAATKAQLGAGPKELAGLRPPTPPSGAPQVIDQAKTAQEQSSVNVVRAKLDALEGNNEAAYLGTMTDDVEIDTLERPETMRGKEDAKARFRSMRRSIAQLDTTIDNIWGVGHYVVVEYSIAGEQVGPIGWVPAQRDKVVRLQVVDVDEMRDGRIAHVWRYDNPAQIAPGGVDAPPPPPPAVKGATTTTVKAVPAPATTGAHGPSAAPAPASSAPRRTPVAPR